MPPRAARVSILIAVIAVFAAAVAVLAVLVLPPALANLTTRVERTDAKVAVGRASVVVPAGWAVRRPPFRKEVLLLTSPDGRLDVTLSASTDAPATAFEQTAPAAPGRIEEPLRSGLTAVHAQTADDTITAAVGDGDGAAVIVAVADGDIRQYAPALAGLLETARLGQAGEGVPQ